MADPDRPSQQPISQEMLAQQQISQELCRHVRYHRRHGAGASSSVEEGTESARALRDLTLDALRDAD